MTEMRRPFSGQVETGLGTPENLETLCAACHAREESQLRR